MTQEGGFSVSSNSGINDMIELICQLTLICSRFSMSYIVFISAEFLRVELYYYTGKLEKIKFVNLRKFLVRVNKKRLDITLNMIWYSFIYDSCLFEFFYKNCNIILVLIKTSNAVLCCMLHSKYLLSYYNISEMSQYNLKKWRSWKFGDALQNFLYLLTAVL